MKYNNNIVAFDLETTGLDKSRDSIIQFAAVKFNVEDSGEINVIDRINLYIRPVGNYNISLQAYFKHGIKPDFLKDKPTLIEVADKIIDFIDNCDLLTFNGNSFDIPFLTTQLNLVGKDFNPLTRNCYDAFREEKRRNGNTLVECFERYEGKTMNESGLEAHNAYSDVMATIKVFNKQEEIKSYGPEKMYDPDGMFIDKEFQGNICPCFAFGKYKDISLKFTNKIDPSYISWILSNSGFNELTKTFIKNNI